MQPLRVLAIIERFLHVHVDAEGAAVDLRRAQLEEVQEARLDHAFQIILERHDGFVGFRRRLAGIQSRLHGAKGNGYRVALARGRLARAAVRRLEKYI